jgi:sulfate transport system ATP-binding protein
VNVFHGRVEGGRAFVNDLEFAAPGATGTRAHVYVRPHELDVHRSAVPGSFAARVLRVVPLGAAVRLELTAPGYAGALEVDLDRRDTEALALAPADTVHLSPRRVRVFPDAEGPLDSLTASAL